MNKSETNSTRQRRDKTTVSLIFLILILSLGGLLLYYWNFVMEPRLRVQAQEQAKFIAQSQVGEIVEALSNLEASGDKEEVIDAMDHALLFSDSVTGSPFFSSVALEIDYDVVPVEEGTLNLTRGVSSCDICFLVDVAIYSKYTDELIGLAWFNVNGKFFQLLSRDVRNNLIVESGIGGLVLILVWFSINFLVGKLQKQINERKQAEEELRSSEEKIKRTLAEKEKLLSEQKKLMNELQTAKKTAEDATKLKDQFVSLVSHDLRSPLSGIMGTLNILSKQKENKVSDEQLHKGLVMVYQSSKNLYNFIGKLLDVSRLQTGDITLRMEMIDTKPCVDSLITRFAPLADQKGIVIKNLVPEGYMLFADVQLISEVVSNLLSNSVKFCRKGDVITLLVPNGDAGLLAVKDNGSGIDKSFLPNLFKHEIKTTIFGSAGETGTGLGLPHSADIIRVHGGELIADSVQGKGATFTIKLPHPEKIVLLVDDQTAHREMMKESIKKISGAGVTESTTGAEALLMLENHLPDLIITDLNMPDMNGFELIRRVCSSEKFKGIPVIAASSLDWLDGDISSNTEQEVKELGAAAFISKPIDKGKFEKLIRIYVG